jgi:hypothetical protein
MKTKKMQMKMQDPSLEQTTKDFMRFIEYLVDDNEVIHKKKKKKAKKK